MPDIQYIIEAEELQILNNNKDVVIIDTREPNYYQLSHIPNSINIHDIFTYIAMEKNGGYSALVNHFEKLLGEKGINSSDPLVFYEDAMDNGYGQSCRGWFILKYLGHQAFVTVLHGGFRAWRAKELPVSAEITCRQSTTYISYPNSSYIFTTQQMLQAINNPSYSIVDVRDYAEWVGANSSPYGYDYCPRKGRIPGALWLEWYQLMTRKGGIPWFKTKEEILETCKRANIPLDKTIILYCFKGARTSNVMLAMMMSGLSVKNYFFSWNEWSRDISLPVEEDYPE